MHYPIMSSVISLYPPWSHYVCCCLVMSFAVSSYSLLFHYTLCHLIISIVVSLYPLLSHAIFTTSFWFLDFIILRYLVIVFGISLNDLLALWLLRHLIYPSLSHSSFVSSTCHLLSSHMFLLISFNSSIVSSLISSFVLSLYPLPSHSILVIVL